MTAKWVRVGASTGKHYADVNKAIHVASIEDPNRSGIFVVALWFDTSSFSYQTVVGDYDTQADADAAVSQLTEGWDPTS